MSDKITQLNDVDSVMVVVDGSKPKSIDKPDLKNTLYADADIKTKYESNADTNAYTDAEKDTTAKVAPGDWSKGDTLKLDYSPTDGYTEADDTLQGHLHGVADSLSKLGSQANTVQVDYFVAGTYGDGVEARLLQVDMKTYSRWNGVGVKLRSVSVTHNTVDSGSGAFININMNGVDGLNGNGVQLGAAGTWVTSTDVSTATLSDGDYIDIKCSVAGGSGDASDLTVICVFEYI